MAVLSRGANAPLATGPVDVAVLGAQQGSVDLMVFQLGADRKVRSDADFVFFNQPASPEGAVRLVAADRVAVDLTAVPADVETLAIAVSLDDGVSGSLASIPGLAVALSGGQSHSAPASGLTVERAAVLIELYRRAGAWKVRNISAGWAAGLSALAGEHGVSVDESPTPPEPPSGPASGPVSTSPAPSGRAQTGRGAPAYDPDVALPPAVLPQQVAIASAPTYQPVPNYPTPGGFPPPGGNLPPAPDFVPPRPGGFVAPGGSLPPRPN